MLRIIALRPTDLPIPVAPATKRCGIFARSTTIGNPLISLPSPMESVDLAFVNTSLERISLSPIISLLLFGISRPITGFPGITSTIRTLSTRSALARSLLRFIIFFLADLCNNDITVCNFAIDSSSFLSSISFSIDLISELTLDLKLLLTAFFFSDCLNLFFADLCCGMFIFY